MYMYMARAKFKKLFSCLFLPNKKLFLNQIWYDNLSHACKHILKISASEHVCAQHPKMLQIAYFWSFQYVLL